MKPPTRHNPNAAGFALLEVLITLVVNSVGLLGLAALLLTGMRFNHGAYLHSQATMLAYDMADRMRADMTAVAAGNYNNTSGSTGTQTGGCTTTSGCSTSQMAANDNYEWNQNLSTLLPSGQGVACLDSTPNDSQPGDADFPKCDNSGDVYAIKIWWDNARTGDNTNYQRVVMSFKP